MDKAQLTLTSAILLILVGCQQSNVETLKKIDETNARIVEVNERLDALKADIQSTTIRLEMLESDTVALQQFFRNTAYLRPGDEGYSIITSDIGALTVQMTDIKPYANGSKVTIKFGNTLSATVDGLNAEIEWGSVDKNGLAKFGETKTKSLKITKPLLAGTWTSTPVVLEDIPPNQLGFVRIKDVNSTGIKLLIR